MNAYRIVEFLGGPLDGGGVPIVTGTDLIVIRDSGRVYRYYADEVVEGKTVRTVFRMTGAAPDDKAKAWVSVEDSSQWSDTGIYWVSIRCEQDGRMGVGLMAGPPEDRVAFTREFNVADGRDYVVTHYCPAVLDWPQPLE